MTRKRWWQFTRTTAKPNAKCPICDAPVVIPPTSYTSYVGVMSVRPTREELIASCAVHGKAPYNTATLRFLSDECDEQTQQPPIWPPDSPPESFR